MLSSKLRTAWGLPLREKAWCLLFFPYSGVIRLALLTLRFRWMARWLGKQHENYQFSPLVTACEMQLAWRIGRIAELVARFTPWQSKCLVQAILVRSLLGYYGVPYVMHLGARLTGEPSEAMKAHAWVKVGAWVVCGREGHQAYAVTNSFVSKSLLLNIA